MGAIETVEKNKAFVAAFYGEATNRRNLDVLSELPVTLFTRCQPRSSHPTLRSDAVGLLLRPQTNGLHIR